MFFLRGLSVVTLSGAVVVSSAVAQNYIPKKITFSGTNMSQSGLLAVSGLKPGEAVGQQDIQAAAQRLIDTGLFSDVHFSFNGLELNYALKAMDGLQPVSYANFPWWDDAALTAAVAAKVPLFRGAIPAQSPMQQEVAAALTELLAEKGVTAKVTGVPRESLGAGNGSGIEYYIDAPPVQVGSFHLSGVSADWAEPVLAVQKAAVGQDFGPATEAALEAALRAIYHRQGYLQMALVGFSHQTPEVADGKVMVPVSATIEQGPQYRVRSLHFAGDSVLRADEFSRIAKLHLADIANEDLLHGTLAEMETAYRRKGYLRAKLDATPSFNAMTRTVDYTINVQPGPVFTMGTLGLVDVSDQQKAEILKAWPLPEGAGYDPILVSQFLMKYKNQLHSLDGWSASYKAFEHEDSHVIDLVVTFRPGGPLQ
jgi:outer membrane protein assembly factor BamA